MKQAREYAKRVKKLFRSLIRKHGKPAAVEPTDPILQLIEGILAINTTVHKAQTVLTKLLQQMVDLNELRVTPAMELAALIGTGVPMAAQKSQWIVDALNDIRKRQEMLDLGFLKDRARREAREYIESLKGVDRSVAARVVQSSLGGHAIPVDDLTLYVLRKSEMVDDSADAEKVQRFLERQVTAADAPAFTELLGKYVSTKGGRIAVEELPDLLNPPPPAPAPKPESAPVKETPTKQKPAKAAKKTAAAASKPTKISKATKPVKKKTTTKAKPAAKKTTRSPRAASKKKAAKTAKKSRKSSRR